MLARRNAEKRSRQRVSIAIIGKPLAVATWALVAGAWCVAAIGQVSAVLPGRTMTTPLNPARPKTYQEVLVFGLQAKLPSELAFVDSVVAAVENGSLPAPLVDQSYFWARSRAGNTLSGRSARPIIYFIPALEARLKKLHLNVDLAGGLP